MATEREVDELRALRRMVTETQSQLRHAQEDLADARTLLERRTAHITELEVLNARYAEETKEATAALDATTEELATAKAQLKRLLPKPPKHRVVVVDEEEPADAPS